MAKTIKQTNLDNNALKVAQIAASTKSDIGRGAPNTQHMQGTTMEVVPDRLFAQRNDDGS